MTINTTGMRAGSTVSLHDKIHRYGANTASDSELLSLFISSGGEGAQECARGALGAFGGLRNLMNSDRNLLKELPGFGQKNSIVFQAILELTRRYMVEDSPRGELLSSPKATRDYLTLCLRDKQYESFFAMFLNSKHRVIHSAELFRGTVDSASVPIREVVVEALKHNASAMIVAHNHPSGDSAPSAADKTLTETLYLALGMVGVKLLDHLVVGDNEMVSFAEMGALR